MDSAIRELVRKAVPDFPQMRLGKIFRDTTDFMRIDYGDVIELGGMHYLVLKDEVERRFGLEDPKFWVKRCRMLETGEPKILKLVFHERFNMSIGPFEIQCFRSPSKEARILSLVRGDTRFMQGITESDEVGNAVRILDVVQGKRLDLTISALDVDHRTYFHELFPDILEKYLSACEAISHLHKNWEKHGDIRRDHLWIDRVSGEYRWIDFDYTFESYENPFRLDIFGLGNILVFLVGMDNMTGHAMQQHGFKPEVLESLNPKDYSIIIGNRLVNIRKLYPYVPECLNNVLLHFSVGSRVFYDAVDEMKDDLCRCLENCRSK